MTQDWTTLPNGLVRTRVRERVCWMVLDAPPANNYSHEMMRDLDEAILAARFEDAVDVIVLTGAGDRFFCSGADIGMLGRVTPGWKAMFCLHANETLSRLEQTPKLTIAALNGHCVGGGFEVAMACDLRLARAGAEGEKPFRIGLPEVKLGVLPGTGGTQRLARLVGKAKALELMLEATLLEPEAARAAGLVTRALAHEDFGEQVQSYAARFTLPAAPTLAVGGIKRSVQSGAEAALEVGLALEREHQAQLFRSRDAQEGLSAFLEKRAAEFEGR